MSFVSLRDQRFAALHLAVPRTKARCENATSPSCGILSLVWVSTTAGHDEFVARILCISGFSGGRLSDTGSECDFTKRKTKRLFLTSASESLAIGSYSNVKAR